MTDVLAPRDLPALDPAKFQSPDITLDGSRRAHVELDSLRTLWFNTGTLCNLECVNCYIDSSPTNDRLVYLTIDEVTRFLDELDDDQQAREIGFTGGEPFMNPDFIAMLDAALGRGYRALVLTNAMRPMMKLAAPLLELRTRYGGKLVIRVSVDHYSTELHELERGPHSWRRMIEGLTWLSRNDFAINIAGRTLWQDSEAALRAGYGRLFAAHGIAVDATDPAALVLFPEMDATVDVPEITEACWDLLDVDPGAMMCAGSRMVVRRKGAPEATVVPCTLLPYDRQFDMGASLREAGGAVKLNHPHCARFCVLGGGACSVAG